MTHLYLYCLALMAAITLAFTYTSSQTIAQTDFWNDAAQAEAAEIALGSLALQKATDPTVEAFARGIVTDHTIAKQGLAALAAAKHVSLPVDANKAQQAVFARLNGMTGIDFDEAFMKQMVADHERTVALFKSTSASSPDADVKAFAAQTLPTLEEHLATARSMVKTAPIARRETFRLVNTNTARLTNTNRP